MKNRRYWLLPFMCLALSGLAQAGDDPAIKKALNGSHRSPEHKARDAYRHPGETLAFFGVKESHTVVEFLPGGGWYTEVLAPLLRDKGKLLAATYDRDPKTQKDWMADVNKEFDSLLKANPAVFDKVVVNDVSMPTRLKLAEEGSVDVILDFRNAHNWMRSHGAAVAEAFFKTLKKGGVVGIVDHRWPEDKEYDERTGYIKASQIIAVMEKAGFKLEGSSEINANPKDTKDYSEGVWTLPPTLALGDKDRAKYVAIGESDRFTLKFVKP